MAVELIVIIAACVVFGLKVISAQNDVRRKMITRYFPYIICAILFLLLEIHFTMVVQSASHIYKHSKVIPQGFRRKAKKDIAPS